MNEPKGETKDTLLDELESIRGLLDDEDEIPVLNEVIESIEPVTGEAERRPPPLSPDSPRRAGAGRRPAPARRASGENPFLPAHIRARLHGNRPPAAMSAPAPEPTRKQEGTESPPDREALLDEVVDACLPEVRNRLRQRLEALSPEQLRALLVRSDDSRD